MRRLSGFTRLPPPLLRSVLFSGALLWVPVRLTLTVLAAAGPDLPPQWAAPADPLDTLLLDPFLSPVVALVTGALTALNARIAGERIFLGNLGVRLREVALVAALLPLALEGVVQGPVRWAIRASGVLAGG